MPTQCVMDTQYYFSVLESNGSDAMLNSPELACDKGGASYVRYAVRSAL